MSGGGGDKSRAGATARVIVVTETDGFDVTSKKSREASKIKQIEGRKRAYKNWRIYKECTVSTSKGHTWKRYNDGTASRIVVPCVHCGEKVTPEREHLRGWQEAETESESLTLSHFCCPACGKAWTEQERLEAVLLSELIHKGQTIDAGGTIHGDLPATRTLGFR